MLFSVHPVLGVIMSLIAIKDIPANEEVTCFLKLGGGPFLVKNQAAYVIQNFSVFMFKTHEM